MAKQNLTSSRREALALGTGLGIGALAQVVTPANAAEGAKASVDDFAKSAPATQVAIGPLVAGNYELAYQENYAQGLRLAGFSEEAILSALVDGSPRLSLKVDGASLLGGASFLGARKIDLGSKQQVKVLGFMVDDYLTYFDQPNRMVTTFTSPSKKRVWSVRRFSEHGAINTTMLEGDASSVSTRVWRRLPERQGIEGLSF
jgi:hypothetical protein